jgi:uncharacterized lipoprotein
MKKQLLILSTVITAVFAFIMAGCSSKPKLEGQKNRPAAVEQTDKKAEETTPVEEHPDSSKPKDHPAH